MRLHIFEPQVRRIAERLAEVVRDTGSVSAACAHLNAALGEIKIHPNRLHTILSCDNRKAINQSSLRTIRLALDKLQYPAIPPGVFDNLDDLALNEWL
jgi:hypothetical protein